MQKIHVTKVACSELSQPVRPESVAGSICGESLLRSATEVAPPKEAMNKQIYDSLSNGNQTKLGGQQSRRTGSPKVQLASMKEAPTLAASLQHQPQALSCLKTLLGQHYGARGQVVNPSPHVIVSDGGHSQQMASSPIFAGGFV